MRKLQQHIVSMLVMLASSSVAAQTPLRIIVEDNIPVSGDVPRRPHVEPSVAADPADSRHLIASAIAFTRPDAWFTVAAFTSFDGGRSWQRSKL